MMDGLNDIGTGPTGEHVFWSGGTTFVPHHLTDDYCDCDKRCEKCGKKKKGLIGNLPWTIT